MRRILLMVVVAGCCPPTKPATKTTTTTTQAAPDVRDLAMPEEVHLKNLHQLTFGGDNAEAYWSFSGDRLIFQTNHAPYKCDQIEVMPSTGGQHWDDGRIEKKDPREPRGMMREFPLLHVPLAWRD